MRVHWLFVPVVVVAPLAAACGPGASAHTSSLAPAHDSVATTPIQTAPAAAGGAPSACRTGDLSVALGGRGGAAGSAYAPLVFTNTSSATCSLYGYPGVSYVAPSSGKQVGAAASRNPAHAATTVTLAPGQSAASLVQMANAANYPAARCSSTPVSGLRVYPPGQKTAAFVAFASSQSACSTDVDQLSVAAVTAGTTGQ